MLMVNTNAGRLRTSEFGGLDLKPGDTCEIDPGYLKKRRGANGAELKSIVEMVAPGLKPLDEVKATEAKSRKAVP